MEQPEKEMREIERKIVSALIFSADGKLLMGRKDPSKGGVYPDAWHIPGGGVDEGESMEEALRREVGEEVGIDISSYELTPYPQVGSGVAEKTLKESGERVMCRMEFNRYKVVIDKPADEIVLYPTDDLVELKWFTPEELRTVEQIPGGREFFQEIGLTPGMESMYTEYLGKTIEAKIDRPLGSTHPKHGDIIYPINYGFVPNTIAGDGEEIDVYILGVSEPVESFTGKCIAVVHRFDDNEDKLVLAPEGSAYTEEEIRAAIHFQDQFFKSEIILAKENDL